jgi:hypothetical protein
MTPTPTTPRRFALRALALAAALAALLVLAAPAAAAKSCGRAVIDDWSDGRIDKQYPLHCYDDAIEMLPRDVRDYSSAEDDMRRALQLAMRGQDAPPNRDTSASPEPAPEEPGPETPPEEEPPAGDTTGLPPGGGDDPGDDEPEVAPPVDTESASSVPIPLLILAGLALLLVAGGSAGYLVRRLQARRVPPPAV